MEYAKDTYIETKQKRDDKRKNGFVRWIGKNKLFCATVVITLVFSILNIYFMISFFQILVNL